MNATELARLERLEQAVFAEVDRKIKKMREAAESDACALLDKSGDEAGKQTIHKAEDMLRDSEAKYKRMLYGNQLSYRQQLLKRRGELTDEIFASVEKRLAEFVLSPSYADYLARGIASLAPVRGDILMVRPGDENLDVYIYTAAEIKADEKIKLGGFMLLRGNTISDRTLDSALKTKRGSFGADYGAIFRRWED